MDDKFLKMLLEANEQMLSEAIETQQSMRIMELLNHRTLLKDSLIELYERNAKKEAA